MPKTEEKEKKTLGKLAGVGSEQENDPRASSLVAFFDRKWLGGKTPYFLDYAKAQE